MSEQQQSDHFGGGKNKQRLFNGRNSGRPNFGGQTQMFNATCTNCRKPCEVPFRPIGDKPVYCRECFMKKRESAPRGPLREAVSQDFSRKPQGASAPSDDISRELRSMNAKLDAVLQKIGAVSSGETEPARKRIAASASRKPRKKSKSERK